MNESLVFMGGGQEKNRHVPSLDLVLQLDELAADHQHIHLAIETYIQTGDASAMTDAALIYLSHSGWRFLYHTGAYEDRPKPLGKNPDFAHNFERRLLRGTKELRVRVERETIDLPGAVRANTSLYCGKVRLYAR